MMPSDPSPTPDPTAPPGPGALDFGTLPRPEGPHSFGAEWWIATAHLRSKKREAFLSIVTLLSILGVTASVAMLNWVIGVMTGFEVDLRDKILGANAHVVVFRYGGNLVDVDDVVSKVEGVNGVVAAAPFVYSEMMLRSSWSSTGVIVKGIDVDRTGDVTHVRDDLIEGFLRVDQELGPDPLVGDLDAGAQRALMQTMAGEFPGVGLDGQPLVTENEPLLPGIIIGKELQEHLQVRVGDKVQLINPLGGGSGPMGMPMPSIRSLRIAGVFDSGMYEYDTKWTYVTNALAQDFLKLGPSVTGIEIKVNAIDDVERISSALEEQLGYPYYTRHWKELNSKLFAAMELEKWVMGLLLQMVVGIAGLLIITTLFMQVLTKGREIAILKAMGATNGAILRIFVIQGCLIGLLGTVLGTLFGLLGCRFLDQYAYPLETDVYYLDTLPVVVDPATVAVIAVSAFLICFLCTIYPAWRAASLDPVEALRYE